MRTTSKDWYHKRIEGDQNRNENVCRILRNIGWVYGKVFTFRTVETIDAGTKTFVDAIQTRQDSGESNGGRFT